MTKIRCAIYTRKSAEEGLEQDFNSLSIIIIYPGLHSRPGLPSSPCWRAWSAREGRC